MTGEEFRRKLCEPFEACDVEWRVTKTNKNGGNGLTVPYITSRAIQTRLDDVVGPFYWRTRFIPWHQYVPKPSKKECYEETPAPNLPISSQLCGLSIYNEDLKEWVEKIDGAQNTDYETIKGGISDSFKRAAVQWGIGRYLYEFDAKWTVLDEYKKIVNPAELTDYYLKQIAKLGLATAADRNTGNVPSDVYRVNGITPTPVKDCPNAAWVKLVTPDQRALQVFYAGAKPGLVDGVCIRDVVIIPRSGAGGQYYELQDYQPAA